MDISDPVKQLSVLFEGASAGCDDAMDANDDGLLNIVDAIYLLNYVFGQGPPPAAPFPDCTEDPTPGNSLDCVFFRPCE